MAALLPADDVTIGIDETDTTGSEVLETAGADVVERTGVDEAGYTGSDELELMDVANAAEVEEPEITGISDSGTDTDKPEEIAVEDANGMDDPDNIGTNGSVVADDAENVNEPDETGTTDSETTGSDEPETVDPDETERMLAVDNTEADSLTAGKLLKESTLLDGRSVCEPSRLSKLERESGDKLESTRGAVPVTDAVTLDDSEGVAEALMVVAVEEAEMRPDSSAESRELVALGTGKIPSRSLLDVDDP